MRRTVLISLLTLFVGSISLAQTPSNNTAYTVTYIEALPSARATALSALKQYRETSHKDSGFVRMEFFEQAGRPAHFVVIETWDDQKASDAHGAAAHTKDLLNKLKPIRLSDDDQRPYKTLSVAPPPHSPTEREIYVISHVDIGGPAGEVPGMLQRLAAASRKEDGNLRFDVLLHTMRANHFTVIEGWQSQKALDAHAAAPHTKQYREALQPMLGSPLDERLFKWVD